MPDPFPPAAATRGGPAARVAALDRFGDRAEAAGAALDELRGELAEVKARGGAAPAVLLLRASDLCGAIAALCLGMGPLWAALGLGPAAIDPAIRDLSDELRDMAPRGTA